MLTTFIKGDFMKKLSVVLLVLATVFGWGVSVGFAAPYVSGNVGAVWVVDSDLSQYGEDTGAEMSFDTGYGVTGALGYAFPRDMSYGYRTEIELGYRENDTDKISAKGFVSESIDGDVSTISVMANVFIEFMPEGTFSPFVGAGIGFANVEGDFDDGGSEDDTVLAYQGIAGVAFPLSQNLKIDVQYRYFATDDPEFDDLEAEYGTHNAMLGLRYGF